MSLDSLSPPFGQERAASVMRDDLDRFASLDMLQAQTLALARLPGIDLTPLGTSAGGRSIDMLSFGDGPQQALIVGVPHANEPVGTATIERLIAFLLTDEGSNWRARFRWSFVTAIDPDGLAMNAGWLTRPRTIENYFHDFFRPSLDRQPETTFPVTGGQYRFERSTPENLAYQRAFALTRPVLHASLHNCSFGGAAHLVSRIVPELVPELDAIIARHGQPPMRELDQAGYPLAWASPGVARNPTIAEIVAEDIARGLAPGTSWRAGELSQGFAETLYGTFTIKSEVPIWHSHHLEDDSPSGITQADQLRGQLAIYERLGTLFARVLDPLAASANGREARELVHAAREMETLLGSSANYFAARIDKPEAQQLLSWRDYARRSVLWSLVGCRGYALLARLARENLAGGRGDAAFQREVETECADHISAEARRITEAHGIEIVPLGVLTGIQMDAILACADHFANEANG